MISKKIKDGELSIDDIDSIRNIFESFVEGNNSKAMGYLKTIENISNIQPSQVKDIVIKDNRKYKINLIKLLKSKLKV